MTQDHLGSPRITTDKDGKVFSRRDFMPFGEEIDSSVTTQRSIGLNYGEDQIRQKFTGYERDDETDLDFAQARMYAKQFGRFTSTDPSRKSIKFVNPQTWNRYTYCLNTPLGYIDQNGKWPTGTHNAILTKALDRMAKLEPKFLKAVQDGSRKVDREGINPKTLFEKNAPQHAMTPGAKVKEIGMEKAQQWARNEAIDFIEGNLNKAKSKYQSSVNATNPWFDKKEGISKSLESFGAAMHPVMDNVSPAHKGFQIYDNTTTAQIGAAVGGATGAGAIGGAIGNVIGSQIDHSVSEGGLWGDRKPTEAEENLMVDEIRLRFQQTYGNEAYEQAVSEEERKLTAERLARRGTQGMLVR